MELNQSSVPELGSILIPFPPGWSFKYEENCPVEGSGPGTEYALIAFIEASPNTDQEALDSQLNAAKSFMNEIVPAVAAERGTPYGELYVVLEKGGRTIYAMASTTDSDGIDGYFLQYVCISLVSQHYINIGGPGAIDEAMAAWDEIMRNTKWVHEV